jgi:hypothetical protein
VTLCQQTATRTVPVRLCDVGERVRVDAAIRCANSDPRNGPDLLFAALHPSDRVYWLSETCRPLVEELCA